MNPHPSSLAPTSATTPAFNRVFGVLELIEQIAQHVSRHEMVNISHLTRESSKTITTLLWYQRDLTRHPTDMHINPPEHIVLWNRYQDTLRSLSIQNDFAWILFAATVGDLQDSVPWITPPRPEGFVQLPLQMPTKLRHLLWTNQATSQLRRYHPVMMSHDPNSPITQALDSSSNLPASWIMYNNPGLETIELSALLCLNSIASRTLIRTISGLQQLKRLTIRQTPEVVLDSNFAFKLFKCVPPSLESLIMDFYMYTSPSIVNGFQELAQPDDSDFHLLLVERGGPLLKLKELRMPYNDNFYSGEQFDRILQSCPKLERLVIPQHLANRNDVTLADSINNHCPLVRHWSIIAPVLLVDARPRDQEAMFRALNSFPTRQVETLSWKGYRDDRYFVFDTPLIAMDCLLRFEDTLCHLRLVDAIQINSITIRTILTRCTQLKSLTIRDFEAQRNYIDILDAVAEPWGCTKIESLEISVEAAATAITPGTHEWAIWGAFARQIGRLSELRSLSLWSLLRTPHDTSRTIYTYQTLPGFLALDARPDVDLVPTAADPTFSNIDQETYPANPADAAIDLQRTGFLIHLAGLTRLQHLRGSFHMNLHTFTDQEANWIRTQWPEFEMLEFLPEDFFLREGYEENAVPSAVMRFRDEMGYRIHAFPVEAERMWCEE